MDASVWTQFALDPRDPAHAHLRAADHDRAVTCALLDEAYAEGRLDTVERSQRTDAAMRSRTLGDLTRLLVDLVPDGAVRPALTLAPDARRDIEAAAEAAWHAARRRAVLTFLGTGLIAWAVWAAVSAAAGSPVFLWPLIVMAVTAAHVLKVQLTRDQAIADERARLERQRAKEIARSRGRLPSSEDTLRLAADAAKRRTAALARQVEADVRRRVAERQGRSRHGDGRPGA
ncbi:DUF1707 domain-containing protein [Nocardioides sp. GY 10127]|uniref:DUF1707 SHOCT-like domain-containing protein n=1 Tax=Nocardioides sp. GY 10127 TaxID=2569762 RepID=UPI0014590547|nr:DUF1707 domain-containing protein [Nocardioides sp. GY 10127]